jgi:hypothetical protein
MIEPTTSQDERSVTGVVEQLACDDVERKKFLKMAVPELALGLRLRLASRLRLGVHLSLLQATLTGQIVIADQLAGGFLRLPGQLAKQAFSCQLRVLVSHDVPPHRGA